MPAKLPKKRRTRVTPTRGLPRSSMSGWLPNSSLSHPIRSMTSSSAGSFPAGKSVENGSLPGMRCCAGSRSLRLTADFRRSNQHLFQGTWNRSSQQHAKCYLKYSKFTGSTSRNIIYLAFSMDYGSRGKIMEFTRNIST